MTAIVEATKKFSKRLITVIKILSEEDMVRSPELWNWSSHQYYLQDNDNLEEFDIVSKYRGLASILHFVQNRTFEGQS